MMPVVVSATPRCPRAWGEAPHTRVPRMNTSEVSAQGLKRLVPLLASVFDVRCPRASAEGAGYAGGCFVTGCARSCGGAVGAGSHVSVSGRVGSRSGCAGGRWRLLGGAVLVRPSIWWWLQDDWEICRGGGVG